MTFALGITNRTVHLSIDQFLSMSDQDFQDMIAYEQGYVTNSPYTDSCLQDLIKENYEVEEEEVDEEIEVDDTLFSSEDLDELLDNDSFGTC